MFCTLIGIFPAKPNLWKIAQTKVLNVNGVALQWTNSYSFARDEDKPDSPLTLIANVLCKEPATPSDIVSAIQAALTEYNLYKECLEKEGCDLDCDDRIEQVECEQWASAPAPLPLSPAGGYSDILASRVQAQGEDAQNMTTNHTMQEWGIFRKNKILSAELVSQLKHLVQNSIDEMEGFLAKYHPELHVGKDNFIFREIASRSLQRFDLRINADSEVGALVDEWIWKQPLVQELLLDMLGPLEEIDHDISVVYSRPGANHQGWHADGNHISGQQDAGWNELGYQTQLADAYSICLFIPLIDLNEDVGFTQFWPGSHRSRDLMGFGKVAELTGSIWDGICDAGDSVWYDYRLMHRGMPNSSASTLRPVVQVIFTKKRYVEKADYNFGKESVFDGNGGVDAAD
jgi:hypothetical protein